MIIGFGFGNPITSILMLLATSLISYLLFRLFRSDTQKDSPTRSELRQYYYEQRRRVQQLSAEFDITDEEIEKRIDEQLERRT